MSKATYALKGKGTTYYYTAIGTSAEAPRDYDLRTPAVEEVLLADVDRADTIVTVSKPVWVVSVTKDTSKLIVIIVGLPCPQANPQYFTAYNGPTSGPPPTLPCPPWIPRQVLDQTITTHILPHLTAKGRG